MAIPTLTRRELLQLAALAPAIPSVSPAGARSETPQESGWQTRAYRWDLDGVYRGRSGQLRPGFLATVFSGDPRQRGMSERRGRHRLRVLDAQGHGRVCAWYWSAMQNVQWRGGCSDSVEFDCSLRSASPVMVVTRSETRSYSFLRWNSSARPSWAPVPIGPRIIRRREGGSGQVLQVPRAGVFDEQTPTSDRDRGVKFAIRVTLVDNTTLIVLTFGSVLCWRRNVGV
jgi:hypothetical protein